MKAISAFILSVGMLSAMPAFADPDTLDSEGYPVMYVRGQQNSWRADSEYRLTRNGDEYSITLPSLDGAFKIGGDQWQYNYGADETIAGDITVIAEQDGKNFQASNLKDIKIHFTIAFNADHSALAPTYIAFGEGSEVPVKGLSGTLPVLYINVYKCDDSGNFITDAAGNKIYDNDVIDRNLADKNYRKGEYWLDINDCQWLKDEGGKSVGSADEPLPLDIKARGNYSRTGFSKKPFKLKLGKKQSLLGMNPDKSKHWTILAHADDNCGYLRNFVGFNLGKRIGLPWTPSQQPVEVVINGDYRGLYFLTEGIRVGDGRVPVTELADNATDPALISGGYLIELDNYDEENQIRLDERVAPGANPPIVDKLRITFDTPEEYSNIQRRFITDQFSDMNRYVGENSDKLWSYLDLDDAVRYYIVEEIISHTEAYHGSTYMFRDRGEGQKWHFSPLWDCGNAFNGTTYQFFYQCSPFGNTWIPSMRVNATFNAKLEATWKWFMSNCYDGLMDDINAYVDHIRIAARCDHERWKGEPLPDSYNATPVRDNSDMDGRRDNVVAHLSKKVAWLRSQFGSYTGHFSEPERDNTPAAPLPDYAKSGVDICVDDSSLSTPEYFDLTGRRVANPIAGSLYIVKQGTKASKVVFK